MTTSARPKDMPWLIPYMMVDDADQALAFYGKAFNFEKRDAVPGDDGKTTHAEMRYKDQIIMLGREGAYSKDVVCPKTSGRPSPITLYLYCEDVDAMFAQAVNAGATATMEPQQMHWGDRMCALNDPFGHSWCFATASSTERQ